MQLDESFSINLVYHPQNQILRSCDSSAQSFLTLLLLLLPSPRLTFRLGVLSSENPVLFASPPLPRKCWQTPIISRKVLKSMRRALCKITPASALPLVYSQFISRVGFRESLEGEGEKRIRKIKPAAGICWPRLCACALGVWVFVTGRAI